MAVRLHLLALKALADFRPYDTAALELVDLDKPAADGIAMASYWDNVDAILGGIEALKAGGEKFLPKLPDETDVNYKFRLLCAAVTNVWRDSIDNLSSRPFQAPITIVEIEQLPQELQDFVNDVDGAGTDLTAYGEMYFFNALAYALDWIFVDYPQTAPVPAGTVRSRADEQAAGLRPYWSRVMARNMLEVRSKIVNGTEQLTYVRMREPNTELEKIFVRIIERDLISGIVSWSLYREIGFEGQQRKFVLESAGVYSIDVIPLVPYATGRRKGRTWRFDPALRDALDLQFKLYRNETGLEYLKALATYPMVSASGVRPDKNPDGTIKPVSLGPMKVLFAPPDGNGVFGSWSFIEPGGTSLAFLKSANEADRTELRELGRQPLTAQSGNLTVITTAVAAQKGNSACQTWATAEDDRLEQALLITAKWYGFNDIKEIKATTFKDFDVDGEGGETLTTLNTARAKNDLSQRTYWDELKRRNVLSPQFNADKEEELLLAEGPSDDEPLDVNGNPIPPVNDNNPPVPERRPVLPAVNP